MEFPITKVCFDAEERKLVAEVLDSGWLVQGPKVAAFETAFAARLGRGEALAMSSCTAALHLLILALELEPGDEVIVPAFTWVATANVVELAGGKPVFADIDLATFNVRPDALAAAYRTALHECPNIVPPGEPADGVHSYQSFVCLVAPEGEMPRDAEVENAGAERDALMQRLEQAGVGTRPGTHAPVLAAFYRERYRLRPEDFPGAWRADRLSIALPLYPGLGVASVGAIVTRLRTALAAEKTLA